jgi:organic radical activating enzyme
MSKTFCILPWIHLSTRPNGEMRVCCTANASGANIQAPESGIGVLRTDQGLPANFHTTTLNEAVNNEYMKNIRKKMLNDEIPASCTKCFVEENNSHISKRIWETKKWEKIVDVKELIENTKEDGSIIPNLKYIDFRMGNNCNLACVMCSPHDSTGWISDWKKIFPQIENPELKKHRDWNEKGQTHGSSYNWFKNEKFWHEFFNQLPNILQLYFAGGEPLIMPHHERLIKEISETEFAKNIELRYNSNITVIPDWLFSVWSKFKKVIFHASVDDIFERNDYIRFPSKFENIVKNLHVLDNSPNNVEVTIACAVQLLNIWSLPDFIIWKANQNFKKINSWPNSAGMINTHFVYHPPQLDVRVLPKEIKQLLTEKYKKDIVEIEKLHKLIAPNIDYETWRNNSHGIVRLEGILKHCLSEDINRFEQTKEWLNLLDKTRNTDYQEIFKELKGF